MNVPPDDLPLGDTLHILHGELDRPFPHALADSNYSQNIEHRCSKDSYTRTITIGTGVEVVVLQSFMHPPSTHANHHAETVPRVGVVQGGCKKLRGKRQQA